MKRALAWAGLAALSLALTGETCTEERNVEVTAGAEITATFDAEGITNTFGDTLTINVATNVDIQQILEDNDFEGQIIAYIEGALMRVVRRDENTAERMVSGDLGVSRGNGPAVPLLVDASAEINDPALADWQPVPLDAAGVALINEALQDYLNDLVEGDPDPEEPVLTFYVAGESTPQGIESDFEWQVKVIMTLVGHRNITVIDPI